MYICVTRKQAISITSFLDFVRHLVFYIEHNILKSICFYPQMRQCGVPTHLQFVTILEQPKSAELSSPPFHSRTETNPVSITLYYVYSTGQERKIRNPATLTVIHFH